MGYVMRFLAASSFQSCPKSATPTDSNNKRCAVPLESGFSQAVDRFMMRLSVFAPSGPIPPHVPKAMAEKFHPSRAHGPSYFACFASSLRFKKGRQVSRGWGAWLEARTEDQP